MKLYDLKNGLNPRRVRIFLAEKGISIPSEFVDMIKGENKGERYLALNPMGTMPVLEFDDGTHLAESIAICRYFEELHPEPPLFGIWLPGSGREAADRPCYEIYINTPMDAAPKDLITDIYLPLK